jgi:hypothetical protein
MEWTVFAIEVLRFQQQENQGPWLELLNEPPLMTSSPKLALEVNGEQDRGCDWARGDTHRPPLRIQRSSISIVQGVGGRMHRGFSYAGRAGEGKMEAAEKRLGAVVLPCGWPSKH